MWFVDVSHPGLGTFKRMSGNDCYVVEARADAQRAQWDARWEREQNARAAAVARREAMSSRGAPEEERHLSTPPRSYGVTRSSHV